METIACIKSRRSRRRFLDKAVSDETIRKIIDCARYAPFGGPPTKECQICDFIIIRDQKTKEVLTLGFDESKWMPSAPVFIAVCAHANLKDEWQEHDTIGALAAENILLAAHGLGLGATFTDVFLHHTGKHKADKAKIREILKVPKDVEVICIIPIGYPDPSEKLEKKELRDIQEMIHFERW